MKRVPRMTRVEYARIVDVLGLTRVAEITRNAQCDMAQHETVARLRFAARIAVAAAEAQKEDAR